MFNCPLHVVTVLKPADERVSSGLAIYDYGG